MLQPLRFFLATILMTCTLVACSGNSTRLPEAKKLSPASGGMVPGSNGVPAAPANSPLALPDISVLPRTGSSAPGDRTLDGSEFDAGLGSARIFPVAPVLNMAPAGNSLDLLSYAIFHFDLPGYSGGNSIRTSWDTLPAASDLFIGVADYASGTWKWYSGDPSAIINLPGSVDFTSPTDQIFVAVVMVGTSVHGLQQVVLGDYFETEPNNTPETADQLPGAEFSNLEGNFGSGGYDGGTVDYYRLTITQPVRMELRMRFSIPGDPAIIYLWDATRTTILAYSGYQYPNVSLRYFFDTPGDYLLQCEILNNVPPDDTYLLSSVVDYSTEYDEVEDNSDYAHANPLAVSGSDTFVGNLGPGGYDGSLEDWYSLDISQPDNYYTIEARFYFRQLWDGDGGINVEMNLWDSTGLNRIATGALKNGFDTLGFQFANSGRYYLQLKAVSGGGPGRAGDYLLRCIDNGPVPTVQLTASPDNGTRPLTVGFDASVTLPPSTTAAKYYWDLNGDGLFESQTDGNTPTTSAVYFAAGNYAPAVRLELNTGAVGEGATTLTVSGSPSEVEPNGEGAEQSITFPFTDFYGDVGAGGYDGSDTDGHMVIISPGETVEYVLETQAMFAPIGMRLVTVNENFEKEVVAGSWDNDGSDTLQYTNSFPGTPYEVYWLYVYTDSGWPSFSGYRLSGRYI